MASPHPEKTPFLPNSHGSHLTEDGNIEQAWSSHQNSHQKNAGRVISRINLVLLAVNIIALLSNVIWGFFPRTTCLEPTKAPKAPYSPIRSSLEYNIQTLNHHDSKDPFVGEPRRELDQAWSDLLSPLILRIPEEEMIVMNKTSVAIPDSSDYAGYLSVYHMLHCVKRMYQSQYREYYSDLDEAGVLTGEHRDHCISVLRKGIMCNADLTINTFTHTPSDEHLLMGVTHWPRKCANWNQIESWASERSVGMGVEEIPQPNGIARIGPVLSQ